MSETCVIADTCVIAYNMNGENELHTQILWAVAGLCAFIPISLLPSTIYRILQPHLSYKPVSIFHRPADLTLIIFFLFNFPFVTYVVDAEQLIIAREDASNMTPDKYPVWPPDVMVNLIHWYARNFDPVLIERPVWWKVTIWWDVLFFGPFYVIGTYAFLFQKNWIRMPSILYSCVLITILTIILAEEMYGPSRSTNLPLVLLLNAPWVVVPLCLLARMLAQERPFGRKKTD